MSRDVSPASPAAVLLGPQRLAPILAQALDELEVDGPVAVITAGWQEREAEDHELVAALGGRPGQNLRLHARGDHVFRRDAALFEANRAKQDRLKALQNIYRRRLRHAVAGAQHVQRLGDGAPIARRALLELHLTSAIAAVRALDAEHSDYIEREVGDFTRRVLADHRPELARHRDEIRAIVEDCRAVAIAGGHVVVLLNRMHLFGLGDLLSRKPVIAWSAGAMALTDRIVLFHDSPPQGRGDAEVLGNGLGLVPGLVALPSARRRLLIDNHQRIALFARRFAPALCVTLDERAWIRRVGAGSWRAGSETFALTHQGERVAVESA